MTTRNDIVYKILFAIELALLPLIIFAGLYLPTWGLCLFLAGLLLVKIWIELFKDRTNVAHSIIDEIGSVAVFTTIITFFIVRDEINLALGVSVIVLIWLYYIFSLSMVKKNMPEFIDAVDFSNMIFECLTICAFIFLPFEITTVNIGLVALILTTVVSIAYRIFFIFKYTKANNIFRKRK